MCHNSRTDPFTITTNSESYAWVYDPLYRLKEETLLGPASGTLNYSFDSVGNRTNRTVTGSLGLTNQSFTFGTNDWLTSDSYDDNGNTTNSSGNSYRYDPLNQLTSLNNGAVQITYNGDGTRVKKTVGGVTTYYLVDDRNPSGYAQVLEEWTDSGGTPHLSRIYSYGLQLISERQPSVSTNYFVFDGHGSTRVLTDIAGNIVNTFTFDAYGNLLASDTPPQTFYLYSGQQFDAHLGHYYLRARTYNPGTGRFWTMDSVLGNHRDPLSLHKYQYCQANPVMGTDPSGHEFTLIGTAVASAIAITLETTYNATVTSLGFSALDSLLVAEYGQNMMDILELDSGPCVYDELSGDATEISWQLHVVGLGGEDVMNIKVSIPLPGQSGAVSVTSLGVSAAEQQTEVGKAIGRLTEQPRDSRGRFAGKTDPNQSAPGEDAVDDFISFMEENGLECTREVTYRTPFEDRRYDVVVRDPKTGAAGSGVEIKSSEGAMNRNDESAKQQFRADRWINMQREPVVSIGKREGIPIGSTYKIQWQVKERPRLWVP